MDESVFNITHPANIILSVSTGTIGALGLPGNLCLMLIILSEYKKRKPHEWLIFALALGDFLLCLNNVALEAPFIINFTLLECKVAGPIDYFFGTLSLYTPPVVAYNRYLSLYDHQKYLKVFTLRNVLLAWSVILLIAVSWLLPFLITGSTGQDDLGLCGIQIRTYALAGVMLTVLAGNFVSYGFLVYFSHKVITKIRNHKKNAAALSQIQTRLIRESQEIIKVMLIISAVPLFAQMPGIVVKFLQIVLPFFGPWVGRIAIAPFALTAAVNAYVTIYVVKEYLKKLLDVLNRCSMHNGTPVVAPTPVHPWMPLGQATISQNYQIRV